MKCPECNKSHRRPNKICTIEATFELNHLVVRGVEIPQDIRDKAEIMKRYNRLLRKV